MKVLIIQQKMIGDVLTSSILFEAIKNKYPNAELHYVINSHTHPVVMHNPFIDNIHFFTPEIENSKLNLWKFIKTIKNEKFDVIIDVYAKISSLLITSFSGAKTKVSIEKGKFLNSLIYNFRYKHKTKANSNAGLAVENRLQLLKSIDINDNIVFRPKIYITDNERSNAKQFLEKNGLDLSLPLIMISVLGSSTNKTYPFNYMANVLDTIIEENPKYQILFNYIPKQEQDAKQIFSLCNEKTQSRIFINVFGKSLREFLAITTHCNALIGNEGGAINMAKALYIPTFTIFSPWIKKEAWNMFDDGKTHVSVHLKDYENTFYKSINHPKVLKPKSESLYKSFKPSFFKEDLLRFLKQIN